MNQVFTLARFASLLLASLIALTPYGTIAQLSPVQDEHQQYSARVNEILQQQSSTLLANKGTATRVRLIAKTYMDSITAQNDSSVFIYNSNSRGSFLSNYDLENHIYLDRGFVLRPDVFQHGMGIWCDTIISITGASKSAFVYLNNQPVEMLDGNNRRLMQYNAANQIFSDSMIVGTTYTHHLKHKIVNGKYVNDSFSRGGFHWYSTNFYYDAAGNLIHSVRYDPYAGSVDTSNSSFQYDVNGRLSSALSEYMATQPWPRHKVLIADTFRYHSSGELSERRTWVYDSAIAQRWELIIAIRHHFDTQGLADSTYCEHRAGFNQSEKWGISRTNDGTINKVVKYHYGSSQPFESYAYYFETYEATGSNSIKKRDFRLWPNPSSRRIMFSFPGTLAADARVYISDISGRCVLHLKADLVGTEGIDVQQLYPGVYFYKIAGKGEIFVQGQFLKVE